MPETYEYETEEVKHLCTEQANNIREFCEGLYEVRSHRPIVFHVQKKYALVRYADGSFGEDWLRYFPGWVDIIFLEDGKPTYDRVAVWKDLMNGWFTLTAANQLVRDIQNIVDDLNHDGFVKWCDDNDDQPIVTDKTILGLILSADGFKTMYIDALKSRCVVGEKLQKRARSRRTEAALHESRMLEIDETLNGRMLSWRVELEACSTDAEVNEVLMRFSQVKLKDG